MERPIVIDAEYIQMDAFNVEPPEGYMEIENYPDCCAFHRSIKNESEKWFKKFPNCCDRHRKLLHGKFKFDKKRYEGVVDKIVKQYQYTECLIKSVINSDDWYENITEYLDYNLHSFGHPNIGADMYADAVKSYVDYSPVVHKDKANLLIKFFNPEVDKSSKQGPSKICNATL